MRYPLDSDIEYAFETAYDMNGAEGWRGVKYFLTELTLLRRFQEAWTREKIQPRPSAMFPIESEAALRDLKDFREAGIREFEGQYPGVWESGFTLMRMRSGQT